MSHIRKTSHSKIKAMKKQEAHKRLTEHATNRLDKKTQNKQRDISTETLSQKWKPVALENHELRHNRKIKWNFLHVQPIKIPI